ncbi:MAG: hypothetical protein ACFE8B_12810 [Candidatus Hermodarchaeota archaeon]
MDIKSNRKALLLFINDYLEALLVHDHTRLKLAEDYKATENGNPLTLGEGIWQTVRTIVLRKSFVDASENQAGFWGVLEEKGGEKALFVLRLKIIDNQITEIETLLSRKGCHPLFSPDTAQNNPLWDIPIPESDLLAREELISIADSYFEGIEKSDGSIVKIHPDCQRKENGIKTTNNPDLLNFSTQAGIYRFDYITKVRERRYPIVDINRGLVWGIVAFDIPGTNIKDRQLPEGSVQHKLRAKPRCLLLHEIFKIEDGLIRDIDAFMTNAPLNATHGWSN